MNGIVSLWLYFSVRRISMIRFQTVPSAPPQATIMGRFRNDSNYQLFASDRIYFWGVKDKSIPYIYLYKHRKRTEDALKRLAKVEYPSYTEELFYDSAGNRSRRLSKGVEEIYRYDLRNRLTEYIKGVGNEYI